MNSFDLAKKRQKKIAIARENERRAHKIKSQFQDDRTMEKIYGQSLSYLRWNGQLRSRLKQKQKEQRDLWESPALLPAVTSLTSKEFNRSNLGKQSQLLKRGANIERDKQSMDDAFARRALRTQQKRKFASRTGNRSPVELIQQGQRPSTALSTSFVFQKKQKDLNKIIKIIKQQGINIDAISNTDIIRAATEYMREVGKLDYDGIAFINNIACLLEPSFWSESIPYRVRGKSLSMKELTGYLESFEVIRPSSSGPSESKEKGTTDGLRVSTSSESAGRQAAESKHGNNAQVRKAKSSETLAGVPVPSEPRSGNNNPKATETARAKTENSTKDDYRAGTTSGKSSRTIFSEETHYPGHSANHRGIAFRTRRKDDESYNWQDTRRSVVSFSSRSQRGGGAMNEDESLWRTNFKKTLETTSLTDDTPFDYYFENGFLDPHQDRKMNDAIKRLPMDRQKVTEPRPRKSLNKDENGLAHGQPSSCPGGRTSVDSSSKQKDSPELEDPIEKRAVSRRLSQTDYQVFKLNIPRTQRTTGPEMPSPLQRTLQESAKKSRCSSARPTHRFCMASQSSERPQSAASIGMRPESVSSAIQPPSSKSVTHTSSRPQSAFSVGNYTNRPSSAVSGASGRVFPPHSTERTLSSRESGRGTPASESGLATDKRPISRTSVGKVSFRSTDSASSLHH
eukprot:gb/GECG01006891.1/.p1 GENE.gb/GECG01006891.1/~~gb/GECG01006891.1/.p1  ORF type:complete len:682 (+),score=95.15 gb/GECG01006891.1/:1-2046(+)